MPTRPLPPLITATDSIERANARDWLEGYRLQPSVLSGGYHHAALTGDVPQLKALLGREPAAAGARDVCGATALHAAVFAAEEEAVDELLRAAEAMGAPPLLEATDLAGLRPLYVAVLCLAQPPPQSSGAAEEEAAGGSRELKRQRIVRRLLGGGGGGGRRRVRRRSGPAAVARHWRWTAVARDGLAL